MENQLEKLQNDFRNFAAVELEKKATLGDAEKQFELAISSLSVR